MIVFDHRNMKKFIIIIIFFQLVSIVYSNYAESNITIPLYHWAYSYLHQLRLRGYLPELNVIQEPYTRAQVSHALGNLQNLIQQGIIKPFPPDQWLIDFLIKEFEIKGNFFSDSDKLAIQPGIWADELILTEDRETNLSSRLRSGLGFNLRDNLCLYNGILLDQSLWNNADYAGEKWRGFAGYTEQAYLRYTNTYFQLTLGRDFINWGSGKTGRLLLTDNAQPLDLLKIDLTYNAISFIVLAAELDDWMLADSLVKKYHTKKANRFLSAHRLSINFKNKLYIAITEALLYGGPNSSWELKYHNPLLYYHGELLNGGGSDGNGFLYLDFDWYPWRNWEFYGEILVDDLQLEKTVPADLEPNEIGIIFGLQHSDIFGLDGSLVGLEYVRIANRTYNSWLDWEKFVHFKKIIGYPLGNNFERWNLVTNYWLMNGFQAGLQLDYIRQGQGSILDAWDTPWKNYTIGQGYHEPFPYGIVERSFMASLNLRVHLRVNAIMESQVSYQYRDNADHQRGKSEDNWSFLFRLHWNINKDFYY